MRSRINTIIAIPFIYMDRDEQIHHTFVKVKPKAGDWWCSVLRGPVSFDIHYDEASNAIAVYQCGVYGDREQLIYKQPIDSNEPFNPIVYATSLESTLADKWLNAEGKTWLARYAKKEADDAYNEAYAKAEHAYRKYQELKEVIRINREN